ncbi:MAG: phosphoribosylformylglycinamidine synthase subunit PurQ [Candidatus Aenigmarchaeota archaeon]|nr:phosphoribosylformylglycinamidine synthase subunit PurQ [Candidatus Aenigmarchaeota archaeon]
MKPVIAVPYFPGSNGDEDGKTRIRDFGMEPLPLYFHFGDETRLEENAAIMKQTDGAFLCGGFPYEDRLGFGRVPAKIRQYADALRQMADEGKPILAVCSGNQIAHAMRLAFPKGSPYKASMLPSIYDKDGKIVWTRFYDKVVHTKLVCEPERTAFTRSFERNAVMPQIVDHGGGRFWADEETLQYLLDNGLIVTQYCAEDGVVTDNFPVNPNGSMLNIESITNKRGNVKMGMCHDERKVNALCNDEAAESFLSMREYIEDGCPDLNIHAKPQDIPIRLKDYSYLCPTLDQARTYDIYIKMLTDDNERTTAQLFLGAGFDIDRRRLICLELAGGTSIEDAKDVMKEIAAMDFLDGIMLKKDLPSVTRDGQPVFTYEVVGKEGNALIRDFTTRNEIVEGFPVTYEDVPLPNPHAYVVKKRLRKNPRLRDLVTNVQTGAVFFFPDERSKKAALEKLFD